jgi:hypothetical protein
MPGLTSPLAIAGRLSRGSAGEWGILAPIRALVFGGVRAAIRGYVAFVVVFLASGAMGPGGRNASLPCGTLALIALVVGFAVGIPFKNSSLGYA